VENGKKNSGHTGGYGMETSEEFSADGMLNPSSTRHKDRFMRKNINTVLKNTESERKTKEG